MNKYLVAAGLACLMLAATIPAVAQPGTVPVDPGKTGEPGSIVFTEGCTAIPDDAYDGTIGTMACFTAPGADLIVDDVNVSLGLNHTWAGDLVVKVMSPVGTVTTVMSRPGFAEPADDGTGCCGNNADFDSGFPVLYDDSGTTDAEDMGLPGLVICMADGLCDYFPNPGAGPGVNLGDFIGEDGSGDWMVCVGDSAGGDAGEICTAEVIIEGTTVPTVPWQGLLILIAILSVVSLAAMRRRAHSS